MTVRSIVRFPNRRLRMAAEPTILFDQNLHALAGDLLDTMRAAPGIGITAPHIGVLQRLVVIELSAEDGVQSFVNPEIIWVSAETIWHQEGSVSMPGVTEAIERCAKIRVGYQDLNGAARTIEAEDLLSVCLQHEIDQLNGIFWLDRLSRLKRDRATRRFEKLNAAGH